MTAFMLTIRCIYAHIHSIVLRRIVCDCTCLAPDKNRGVILIFKGIIESIPEVYAPLNAMRIFGLLVQGVVAAKVSTLLLPYSYALFGFLPPFIKNQVQIL
ncbi:unnamed protein product [Brassica napus]|uniref:(rape) hypothetical protein n=1 Tax=Brassica napus TaxID=3708 RepID=A0A816K8L6_BRANA|nr:unnamed protein product [Brassica napus]